MHSFANSDSLEYIFDIYDVVYSPFFETIALQEVDDIDILLIEGAIDKDLKRGDTNIYELIDKLAQKCETIVAVGTCASFGGIFAHKDDTTTGILYKETDYGLLYSYKNKTINLSGCPIHPIWLSTTLISLANNKKIPTDELQRPLELYAHLSHHGCTRNEYFEWKVDTKGWGTKEGCLFYSGGCRAPMTHSSCNKILWNDINSKTRAGMPCLGCTEPSFPRIDMYTTPKNMSIPANPPLGVTKRAYISLSTIAKTFHIERLEKELY
jgi:hydrogenase small subunit